MTSSDGGSAPRSSSSLQNRRRSSVQWSGSSRVAPVHAVDPVWRGTCTVRSWLVPVIDTHSHWMPPAHLAAVRQWLDGEPALRRDYGGMLALADRSPSALTELDLLLAEMDDAGVATSAIALPPPAATFGAAPLARSVAAAGNDAMLAAADEHPGRLAVLVALPLPHVDEAIAEL